MQLSEFTPEKLQPLTGSAFHVHLDDGRTFDLTLEEVKVMSEKHVSSRFTRAPFSLFFIGPQNVFVPQQTYTLSHDELGGPWPLFIVPVGRRDGSFLYEAAFT